MEAQRQEGEERERKEIKGEKDDRETKEKGGQMKFEEG